MIESLPGVTLGSVTANLEKLGRGVSYAGNTCEILTGLTDGAFFIDNGVANVLAENECIDADTLLINASAGLLGTPLRENTFLRFDMLFEPRVLMGQRIKLESTTLEYVNGYYKAVEVKHKGMISEATAGQTTTSVGLFFGTRDALKIVPR